MEHQFQKSGVEVLSSLEDTLPAIKGNAGKLQQVFLNLFLNARDAMPGGGVLAVGTMAASTALIRVNVRDNGAGIVPEHIARIFDPFFTTKAPKKGTGLGPLSKLWNCPRAWREPSKWTASLVRELVST